MTDKKTKKDEKAVRRTVTPIRDLEPIRDPKGGEMKTSVRNAEPRGGWDHNHNPARA